MSDDFLELLRERHVYSVSRLNREARALLEENLGVLWVEGELSGLARPSSGHLYFSLKDDRAQVRCAMFRQHNRQLRFAPRDGLQVLITARVSLYEPRGDYQLIVEHMEESGEGLLRRRFEELKARLAAEGLFAEAIKRPIPAMPKRIGVITSPTGAAVHDILTTLARRFPAIPVLVYPTSVQGAAAPAEIAAALALADARRECDVLILARGGGSLEDLQAFNEEIVARAMRACGIPVVTGIGHEVDVTIADFAADLRAPTPTGAAERVAPDRAQWHRQLERIAEQIRRALRRGLQQAQERLQARSHRLQRVHPRHRLRQEAQSLDGLERRLKAAADGLLSSRLQRVQQADTRLRRLSPQRRLLELRFRLHALQDRPQAALRTNLARHADRMARLDARLQTAARNRLQQIGQRLALNARALQAVSPLATLERGYAIVQHADGRVVREARELAAGDAVQARLHRGRALLRVESTEPDAE